MTNSITLDVTMLNLKTDQKTERLDHLTHAPVVGRYYMVPAVYAEPRYDSPKAMWVPVLGNEHDDIEIFDFPQKHYHFDFRFCSDSLLDLYNIQDIELDGFNSVLVVAQLLLDGQPTLKRFKCHRAMPEFPIYIRRESRKLYILDEDVIEERIKINPTVPELEKAFKSHKVVCNRCPHKGLDLSLIPFNQHGLRVCPLHGLASDKDGNIVRRTKG